jgi:cleavage and polyadenylation specificity factor subunit 1
MCKDAHPTNGFEHAVYCNYFNSSERNLVAFSVNYMKVYRLVPISACSQFVVANDDEENCKNGSEENLLPKVKLECLASYDFDGQVAGVTSARLAGSARDSLLVCFRDVLDSFGLT